MSEKYKFHNPEEIYFTTSTIVNWIDLFTRKDYAEIVLDSLASDRRKRFDHSCVEHHAESSSHDRKHQREIPTA